MTIFADDESRRVTFSYIFIKGMHELIFFLAQTIFQEKREKENRRKGERKLQATLSTREYMTIISRMASLFLSLFI